MVFRLSRQVMEGENKLVNLIDDWEVLADYAGDKLGFYQELGNDGTIEIRVQTGRLGFKKEFISGEDKELIKIEEFCKKHQFIKIRENVRDGEFFR
jgi:hypothetical protein